MYPTSQRPQGSEQPNDGFESDTPSLFLEINEAASCLRDCEENLRNAEIALKAQVNRLCELQAIFDNRVSRWRSLAPDRSLWGQQIHPEDPMPTPSSEWMRHQDSAPQVQPVRVR